MPNFWSVTTQKIAEAFSGPRTKDVEFDQKVEEMITMEKSIITLKTILFNFVSSTSGIKTFCKEFNKSIKTIYDCNSSYGSLGNDLIESHCQIERAYDDLIAMLHEITLSTSDWNRMFDEAKNSIIKREESRKVYDHYDEKMEKLYRSRKEKIKKNIQETPKEYELISRNEEKYKKATETYISLSTIAYEDICSALEFRYSKINPVVSRFIECENRYYQSIYNSFRMLENVQNKFESCNKKYTRNDNTYDPKKYIRGGDLIKTIEKQSYNRNQNEELDNPPIKSNSVYQGSSISKSNNTDNKPQNFNEKSNYYRQQSYSVSNNIKAEESEVFDNPYASINFANIPNTYSSGNNIHSNPIRHTNTFDFRNFTENKTNPTNNYYDFNNNHSQPKLHPSNTVTQKDNIPNKANFNYPDFNNINQISNNINTGYNFYQHNKESIHQGYNFYQNNQQQINQGVNEGINLYNKNQKTIDNLGKTAFNNSNQGNQSKDKNYDVFQDFFK